MRSQASGNTIRRSAARVQLPGARAYPTPDIPPDEQALRTLFGRARAVWSRRPPPMIADVTRGISEWWAPALAFAAGVVSFASPCVLPLVPGYLAFVSGSSTVAGEDRNRRR